MPTTLPLLDEYEGTPPSILNPDEFDPRADYTIDYIATLAGTQINPFVLAFNTLVGELVALAADIDAAVSSSATSLDFLFDSSTADSDPGPGKLRLNDATAPTSVFFDLVDRHGTDQTATLALLGTGTSATKGTLKIMKADDGTVFMRFAVTALTVVSGYRKAVGTLVQGPSSPFAAGDHLICEFTSKGDKGDQGVPGANGSNGAQGPAGVGSYTGRVVKTANYAPVLADAGKLIACTSALTLTFDTAANLGASFENWVSAEGADVTIAASDGRTSWIMYAGEMRRFYCDGTTLRSAVIQPFYKAFTSSANFIKPPGYSVFDGLLWGSGAGGRSGAASGNAGGAGGGACVPFSLKAGALANSETVTIAAGGAADTAGGTSSLGSLVLAYGGASCTGGAGGGGGGALSAGTAGSGGTAGTGGAPGANAANSAPDSDFGGTGGGGNTAVEAAGYGGGGGGSNANPGGKSIYGGGGGGAESVGSAGAAGTSVFGGNGGAGGGGAGVAPGGGGGGKYNGTGGAGARGELRIWGVA